MRVLKSHKVAIRRPGTTIGQLEALAGIPSDEASRHIFWTARRAEVMERTGAEYPASDLVFERAREVCYKLIEWRMAVGELSILL